MVEGIKRGGGQLFFDFFRVIGRTARAGPPGNMAAGEKRAGRKGDERIENDKKC